MNLLSIGDAQIAFKRLGCAGPPIVFEAGLGSDMRNWEAVARPLADVARIVLYDRPGIGRSGPRRSTEVLLASTVADELLACLHAMDVPHLSFGRPFARRLLYAGLRSEIPAQDRSSCAGRQREPARASWRVRFGRSAATGIDRRGRGGRLCAKCRGNVSRPTFSARAAHCPCCDRARRHA